MPKRLHEENDPKPILTREEILEKKKAYWREYYYSGRVKKTPEQIERKKEYLREYVKNNPKKKGTINNNKKAKNGDKIISDVKNNNIADINNDVQIFVGFLLTVSNKN